MAEATQYEWIFGLLALGFAILSLFAGTQMNKAKGFSKRFEGHMRQVVDFFTTLNDGWDDDNMSEEDWIKTFDKGVIIVEEIKDYLPKKEGEGDAK